MDISDLYNLPTDEKLRIVSDLWDNIAESRAPLEFPPAVLAEIERRRLELNTDSSIEIDRDEVWRRVNQSAQDSGSDG